MADTEDTATLAELLWSVDGEYSDVACEMVLTSDWLLARDERIRADEREKLAAEVATIADEWDAALRREFRLSDDDPKWTDWHSRQLRAALAGEVEAR